MKIFSAMLICFSLAAMGCSEEPKPVPHVPEWQETTYRYDNIIRIHNDYSCVITYMDAKEIRKISYSNSDVKYICDVAEKDPIYATAKVKVDVAPKDLNAKYNKNFDSQYKVEVHLHTPEEYLRFK